MLPTAAALSACGGVLFLGGDPPWSRAAVIVPVAALLALWGLSRAAVGYATMPSKRNLVWAAALAAAVGLSAYAATGKAAQSPDAWVWWNAVWIFPMIAAISKDERAAVDDAVRAAAWTLMVLAFYQRFVLGIAAPTGSLPSAAAFSAAVLLLAPIAFERSDRLLLWGLMITLIWSGGVDAWLALFAAFALTTPWKPGARLYGALAGVAVCLVVLYGGLESPEFSVRAAHWSAVWSAILERPLLGGGPGFWGPDAYAPSALLVPAELGVGFSILALGGIWRCISVGRSPKTFGVLALAVYALMEPVFSTPGILWLFAYSAASSISEGSECVEIRIPWRLPVGAGSLGAGYWIGRSVLGAWGGR